MSINTTVYGDKTQWGIVGTSYPQGDDKNFYTVFFGNSGALSDGIANNKISLNTPIDKSLSWCVVGNFSTLSNVEYYNQKQGDNFEQINKDNRQVTNFAFLQTGGNVSQFYYANTSSTTYGQRCRWSPEATDGDTSSTSNYNKNIVPLAQIPIKNCVLVPVLRVKQNITDISSSNVASGVYMWDYMNTNSTVNYTTHPYILNVGFELWGKNNDNETNRSKCVTGGAYNTGIAILDELTYAQNQPFDVSAPIRLQDTSYSYCCTSKIYSASINGIFDIFGLVGNNNIGLPIPTTNNIIRQAGCGVVLPHPDGVLTDVVSNNRLYYVAYYNGFQEWVRKQIACFGLFFTDDEQTAKTGDLDAETMFLGTLVNNIGNGDYTHGADNRNQPQWNWNNTNDSNYDPSSEVDPNAYNGKMRTRDLSVLSTATQRYALSPTATIGMLNELWDIIGYADPDEALTDYSVGEFLATNPIDCIVSLQYIPVVGLNDGTATHVRFGTHDTAISCQGAKTSIRVDCGNYKIYPRFGNNWIDRQTKITLYLPFCGTVNLDPEMYMNKSVNVEYLIDLTTGACSAAVSMIGAGGERIITDIANGNCAMDLPVTGIQQQTLNSQLFNASEQTKQLKVNNAFKGFNSIMNGVSSLQGGNPVNGINGLLGVGQDIYNIFQSEKIADYNLQHTMIPTKMIGTTGGITGAMCELYPTVIFERPYVGNSDDWSNYANYAHSIGYACCISGSLSDFTGYTEITNVDLSGFNATATEKNMIQSALAGGVYL